MSEQDRAASRKDGIPDEETLMKVLSSFGVSRIELSKLIELTNIPGPTVTQALRELMSRGLVAEGHDEFTVFYYLTEKGDELARKL